jgi:glycosyltransferase involved in cell wall biosynthesis
MTPLITVVIPTYNYGHLVSAAVDSALAQTHPRVEVIVVDDGSTDDTASRLTVYGDRIRVIRQANQGLSAARNAGIRAAAGEFVALLDSDDAFHPRKLERQAAAFAARPELALVGTAIFSDEPPVWATIPDAPPQVVLPTLDELVIRTRFAPSSAMIRKSCLDAVGLFDTDLRSVEDRDMWIRVGAGHVVGVIEEPLTWYRQTPGSMSRHPERMESNERRVLDKAFALPSLRRRRVLRRRSFGLASATAAYLYHTARRPTAALRRLARSFAEWPLPYRVPDVKYPFARLRLGAAILRHLVFGYPTGGAAGGMTAP